jgi:hypothetical protein
MTAHPRSTIGRTSKRCGVASGDSKSHLRCGIGICWVCMTKIIAGVDPWKVWVEQRTAKQEAQQETKQ